ncbi:MAG: energy transducer TonB [Chitinophagia bacterium]|nr:energy transducer TonB [Chitinophagia bacterium]
MKSETILESSYIDIVYNNRNTAYGGYQLRKSYPAHIKKAGLITLWSIAILSSFSYIERGHNHVALATAFHPTNLTEVKIGIPPAPVVPPKTQATPPPAAGKHIKWSAPVVTRDDSVFDELPEQRQLTHADPNVATGGNDSISMPGQTGDHRGGDGRKTFDMDTTQPFVFVEEPPVFNGNLNAYLAEHLQYPEEARNAGREGRVIVKFVVQEDGTIANISLARGIGYGCDEAAIKVITEMPKWKPARNNGRPVKAWFTQPLSFRIDH